MYDWFELTNGGSNVAGCMPGVYHDSLYVLSSQADNELMARGEYTKPPAAIGQTIELLSNPFILT